MLLKETSKDSLVEVLTLKDLFDPFSSQLIGRHQEGEDPQDPERFNKQDLCFLSGEPLPRCWVDPHYRDEELKR